MATDFAGERIFPKMHNIFVQMYKDGGYAETIKWKSMNIQVNDDQLRQVFGYISLISGMLLILTDQFQPPCVVMLIVGLLSVYCHVTKNDPLYMICGGLTICLVMIFLLFAKPKIHEKTD
ncbi:unnamed protein product [Clavelina lepadiformis]|uniref:Uncharacterized protein n=1 Tax=Clavelina lepadiformis TaxID=159417 RepID=A0ABP0EY19_CLALP